MHARSVWEKARRELDNIPAEAARRVAEDERKTREENVQLENDLWDSLEKQLTARYAADARGSEKTGAAAARAAEDAKKAAWDAEKAEADAKAARAAADAFKRAGWKDAKSAADYARAGLDKAERAFADAARAVEKAKGRNDAEALAAASAAFAKAKQARSVANTVQEFASKSWKEARDKLASLEKTAEEAEGAVPAAKGRAKAAEAARKEAAARDAANRKAVAAAGDRAAESVAILRKAFDRQVEDAMSRRGPVEEEGIDVDRTGAREIQDAYRAFMRSSGYRDARDAYARARAAIDRYASETNRVAVWSADPRGKALFEAFRKAREAWAPFRENRAELEDRYNAFFSEAAFRTDDSLSDADADARHETEAARRDLHGYRVKGDRRWLARTSVRPAFADRDENLLDVLLDEFSWQADRLAEAGEAKRGEGDPLRVDLSDEQASECAKAAALAVKRRAIYSGFYFFGADPEEEGSSKSIWVDKGRFGPARVYFGSFDPDSGYFVPAQGPNGKSTENGSHLSKNEILSELSSAPPEMAMQGETFNFYDLVKRLRNVASFRHVKHLDVSLSISCGFDYGYDDLEGYGVEDVTITNRMDRAVSLRIQIAEKDLWESKSKSGMLDNYGMFKDLVESGGDLREWTPSVNVDESPLLMKLEMPVEFW